GHSPPGGLGSAPHRAPALPPAALLPPAPAPLFPAVPAVLPPTPPAPPPPAAAPPLPPEVAPPPPAPPLDAALGGASGNTLQLNTPQLIAEHASQQRASRAVEGEWRAGNLSNVVA